MILFYGKQLKFGLIPKLVASLGSLPLINVTSSSEVIKLLGLWLSLQDKQAEVEDREEWEGESCRLWAYQTHPSRKRGVSEVLCRRA